jgi:hypothetical protein
MSPTRKAKSTSRKSNVRKRASKRAVTARALHKTSAQTRASVFRGIHRVLKEHGVTGRVAQMHLDTASPIGEPCPPNTIRRVVCSRQDDGTMQCEEQCVPV